MENVLGAPCSISETFIRKDIVSINRKLWRTSAIVTEIKIINCRPLTYIYNDNSEEVVTLSHLIYGRRLLSKPSNHKPDNFNVENLTQRMQYLHILILHYWNRWKLEYLNWTPWIPQMRERRRHTNKCRWYCTCWRSFSQTKLLEIRKNHQTYQRLRWKS